MAALPFFNLGELVVLTLLAQSACRPAAAQDAIERVADLGVPRAAHTATTLPSGQVLVAGGMAGGASLATAELFDPAGNSVAGVGSLSAARLDHSATLLPDGRVLLAGGYDGNYLRSIEIFDPTERTFRPAGSLVEGRSGHTATLLPDGRILIVGGVGRDWTFLSSAEVYDPATGRSEPVGSMSEPRESHTATLLADGRVLVAGGHAGRRPRVVVYASAEIFDPRTGRFEATGRLTTARHKHDAVRLPDGRVLIVAGADHTDRLHYATTEIYDPARGAFALGPSMAHRRYKIRGTVVLLSSGEVLVPTGATAAEILDPDGHAFREVSGRFPSAYRFAATAPLEGGDVVIVGGYDDDNRDTAGVWRFRAAREAPSR